MNLKRFVRMPLFGCAVVLLAWGSTAAVAADGVAARVNGTEIATERLDLTFATYLDQQGVGAPALGKIATYRALRAQVLETLIAQELLWQHAKGKEIVASDEDVDKVLDQIKSGLSPEAYQHRLRQVGLDEPQYRENTRQRMSVEQMVERDIRAGIEISDQEVGEFYAANPDSFKRPVEAHLRHILFKVDRAAEAEAKAAVRETAAAVLAEARAPDADFAALAKEHSQDTTAEKGGDLGFVQADMLVKAFSDAAFALQPGEVSDLVETQFGYHIIRMDDRRGGDLVPEEEVRERVREHLLEEKSREALQALLGELRKAGKVEILENL